MAPIASAVESVQRLREVEEFEAPTRKTAITQLIEKIKAMPANKKLVAFDAPLDRRSTAGNIASKLRKADIDAICRTVGSDVRVYVTTHPAQWIHPKNLK